MQFALLPALSENTKPAARLARRLAAYIWTSVRDGLTFFFYCKVWKREHVVDKAVVDGLFVDWLDDKEDHWIETRCMRCHCPVYVCADPDDTTCYLMSEAPY